jgi:hypothetical protein
VAPWTSSVSLSSSRPFEPCRPFRSWRSSDFGAVPVSCALIWAGASSNRQTCDRREGQPSSFESDSVSFLAKHECTWMHNIKMAPEDTDWGGGGEIKADWSDPGLGLVEGSCACGNEPSGSTKRSDVAKWLYIRWPLEQCSADELRWLVRQIDIWLVS